MNDLRYVISESDLIELHRNKSLVSIGYSWVRIMGDKFVYYVHVFDGTPSLYDIFPEKLKNLLCTDFYTYEFLNYYNAYDEVNNTEYITKVKTPYINETGEIIDKPGTFLDFDKPETLDEQLAEIYDLTAEEQELMKNSIKPWKDKLSLTADGLY